VDTLATPLPDDAPQPPAPVAPSPLAWRRWVLRGIVAIALLVVLLAGVPWVRTALRTVSTDDAYVNDT
jgi:membrane fusion protein (multidrug efflux system)